MILKDTLPYLTIKEKKHCNRRCTKGIVAVGQIYLVDKSVCLIKWIWRMILTTRFADTGQNQKRPSAN